VEFSRGDKAAYPPASRFPDEERAKWLEMVLADEHERDKKQFDRLELPD